MTDFARPRSISYDDKINHQRDAAISEPTLDEPSGQPERRIRRFVSAVSKGRRRGYPLRSPTEMLNASVTNTPVDTAKPYWRLSRSLQWMPRVFLALTVLVQITVWNAPTEIRWDGGVKEWPIPWIVCCNSLESFLAVIGVYIIAWVSAVAVACQSAKVLAVDFVLLIAFPLVIFGYMHWYYFG